MQKYFKFILISFFILSLWTLFLIFPKACSTGASNGINFCAGILVPSLFPFMILSSFTVKSGFAVKLGKYLQKFTQKVFRLPGVSATGIIISCIGGYPTGARTIKSLTEKNLISQKQAEHMIMFCVCAGPGFIINAVGLGMLNNFACGIILFISQVASFLILGFITAFILGEKEQKQVIIKNKDTDINISQALVESVNDSISSMVVMCGFVILFSSLSSIFEVSGITEFVGKIFTNLGINKSIGYSMLPCILEITNGCKTATMLGAPLEFISFALGFSGICVHFQLFSILNGINKIKFLLFRFLSALLSAVNTHILLLFFPQTKEVFLPLSDKVQAVNLISGGSIIGTLSIFLMSVIFLVSLIKCVLPGSD